MGVRGLFKFISRCGRITLYEKLAGQCVAIDVFQKIYKYCMNKKYNYDNPQNAHLKAILNTTNHLLQYNIIPVYIFDGTALQFKVKNKTTVKIENTNSTNEDGNITEFFKIAPKQIKECEKLIRLIGFKGFRAPYEADSQCAAMTMESCDTRMVSVITDDTDTLVFGARSILRMFPYNVIMNIKLIIRLFLQKNQCSNQMFSFVDMIKLINQPELLERIKTHFDVRRKYDINDLRKIILSNDVNFAMEFTLEDVLNYLTSLTPYWGRKKFTQSNLIDISILFGSDYLIRRVKDTNETIFNDYVKNDCDIQKYITFKNLGENYLKVVLDVKNYYENASVMDPNTMDLSIDIPMKEELKTYLVEHGFPIWFIEMSILKYERIYDICSKA